MASQRHGRYQDLYPPQIDYRGRYLCRVCREPLKDRLRSFCSDRCRDDALIRCWPSKAGELVYRRDQGVCARCGFSVGRFEKVCRRRWWRLYWCSWRGQRYGWGTRELTEAEVDAVNARARRSRQLAERWDEWVMAKGWPSMTRTGSWWEAHHKVPVVEGGGTCGLDNYETLCIRCHKAETAALAKRRAEERRGVQRLL